MTRPQLIWRRKVTPANEFKLLAGGPNSGIDEWDLLYNPPPPPPPPPNDPAIQVTRLRGTGTYTVTPPGGGRDSLVIGEYIPTVNTAGVLREDGWGRQGIDAWATNPAKYLTEVPASTTTYASQTTTEKVVQNQWFTGQVVITGRDYTFRNCHFAGDWARSTALVYFQYNTVFNLKFIDCTFQAQNPQWGTAATRGWHVTFERCHVLHIADGLAHVGFGSTGSINSGYTGVAQDVTFRGCLIERGAYISPDPGANGGLPDNRSHLDMIAQMRGGKNFLYEGNAFYGFVERDGSAGYGHVTGVELSSGTHATGYYSANETSIVPGLRYCLSGFMFAPFNGSWENTVIRNNWMDGALYIMNIPPNTPTTGTGITITGNNFGRIHGKSGGLMIVGNSVTNVTITNNKYYYSLDQVGTDDEPNTIPGLAASGWKRHLYTTARSTWPDANIRTNGG